MATNKELIYIWDAYCGWCYGFSSTIHRLHENHPELPLTIWNGGLFIGNQSHSIGSFPHIPEANQRISQLTGVEFGADYEQLLQEGSFIMDSEQAAIGLYALCSLAPDRALELASAMQQAFYYYGKSLSDPQTYRDIALAHHMDANAVLELVHSSASAQAVRTQFATVRHLGVQGYPTLLLRNGDEYSSLGGTASIEELEARLARTTALHSSTDQHCALDHPNGC